MTFQSCFIETMKRFLPYFYEWQVQQLQQSEDVREDTENYITYILHSSIYLKRKVRAIFYILERS